MSFLSPFKPLIALAQKPPTGMTNARDLTNKFGSQLYGSPDANIFEVMGMLINVLLSILGVILLGFVIVAGFYWITAGGNSSQVDKAKTLIKNAVIGLIIIMVSLALSRFIQTNLIDNAEVVSSGQGDETEP